MFLGVAPGALDRCEVAVEPLDPDERMGLGQLDGGPADATADVSDQGGQVVHERRPVERGLACIASEP